MISVIHPSRNRPSRARRVCDLWNNKKSGIIPIEWILSIDSDDRDLDHYKTLFSDLPVDIIINPNKSLVEASNVAAELTSGNIIVLVSDDFKCPENWDLLISAEYKESSGVLKTVDGLQEWIVTLPVMDRAYYKEQGYFYHPSYKHMFCDTDMTHKADLEGKLIFSNAFFQHEHHTTGRSRRDEVNDKAMLSWEEGERIYLERCKNKFGVVTEKNILEVNPLAKNHIQWLQRKLKSAF